jgi:hypothetical protein
LASEDVILELKASHFFCEIFNLISFNAILYNFYFSPIDLHEEHANPQ